MLKNTLTNIDSLYTAQREALKERTILMAELVKINMMKVRCSSWSSRADYVTMKTWETLGHERRRQREDKRSRPKKVRQQLADSELSCLQKGV